MSISIPQKPLFWAVALGHAVNDIFMSMGPILLVFFLDKRLLILTAAQIGLAVSAREAVGAVSQPLFGWLSDRSGGRWIGSLGVIWVATMLMLAIYFAVQGEFWLMAMPYALSALGSGAFHPVGAKYAAEIDTTHQASNTAYFFLFGQIGLAFGPAAAGFLLQRAAPDETAVTLATFSPIFLMSLVVLPVAAFMAAFIPGRISSQHAAAEDNAPTHTSTALSAIVILIGLLFFRSVAHLSTVNFVPVLFESKGWTPAEYGTITSMYWLASSVTIAVLGSLADHLDGRWLIAISMGLAAPALFVLPMVDGPLAFVMALISGALVGGPFSIIIVLAQRIIPSGRAFSAGLVMGSVFVAGAVGNLLVGIIADGPASLFGERLTFLGGGVGINGAFYFLAGCALLSGLLALMLPKAFSNLGQQASGPVQGAEARA